MPTFIVSSGEMYQSFISEVTCAKIAGVMENAINTEDNGIVTTEVTVADCWSIAWGGDGGITCQPKTGNRSKGCSPKGWGACGGGNVLQKILNAKTWSPETKLLHLNYGYNAANTQGGNCDVKGAGRKSPSKLKDCCCQAEASVKLTCFSHKGDQGSTDDQKTGWGDPGAVTANIPKMPVSCAGGNTLGGDRAAISVATGPRMAPCPNRKDYTILRLFGSTLCCKNPAGLPGNMACDLHVGPYALTKHDASGGPWACANGQSYQYLAPVSGPNDTCGFEALAGADLCGTSGYFPQPCANPFAGITSDTFTNAITAGCTSSATSAVANAVNEAMNSVDIKLAQKECEEKEPGCMAALMTLTNISVSCSECPDPDAVGPGGGGLGDGGLGGRGGRGGPRITDPKFDIPSNPGPSDPGGI